MARHYLDHASTSPTRPEAREAMVAWLLGDAGDPARIHHEGQTARVAVEQAREQVAALLGARSREVVFTSGATEAIADAVFGATAGRRPRRGQPRSSTPRSASAPPATTSPWSAATARAGSIRVALLDAVRPDTALVHVQWGNHEVGTTQPVAEVVDGLPRARGARPRRRRTGRRPCADRLPAPRRRPPVA